MLSYAWYIYIENKPEFIRREAALSLSFIRKAGRLSGSSKKLVAKITTGDLRRIKSVIDDLIIDPDSARITVLYLLKFLHILNGKNLIQLNIIDIADAL